MSSPMKIKFVGDVEMIEASKYHHLVYSILDIAALNKVICMNDKFCKTNMIRLISPNMLDLTSEYQSENTNWAQFIPLWITALFDFNLNGTIDYEICKKLQQCCEDKNDKECINVFLYSFWTYVTRVMPVNDKSTVVYNFMKYIATK